MTGAEICRCKIPPARGRPARVPILQRLHERAPAPPFAPNINDLGVLSETSTTSPLAALP
jgi:hypothetical protein